MTTKTLEYGYGHTREASALVRNELKQRLAIEIREYGLKVSVKVSESRYGGPRVSIKTNDERFANHYHYIVDEQGNISNSGRLMVVKTTDNPRWDHRMQLVRSRDIPGVSKIVHEKIAAILGQFGRDNDDAMTDYFDNTMPLFYGIDYEPKDQQ